MFNPLDATEKVANWIGNRKAYSFHPWDPPAELVQGSVRELMVDCEDSFFDGINIWKDGNYIDMKISAKDKYIKIVDLGRGFPGEQFLGLGQSTHLKGNKVESGFGRGLSAVLAQSDLFRIVTRKEGAKDIQEMTFKSFYEGLNKAEPLAQENKPYNDAFFKSKWKPYTGKVEDLMIDSSWDKSFTYIEVRGERGLAHVWEMVEDESGAKMMIAAMIYHSALGLSNKIHGNSVPRKLSYKLVIEDEKGVPHERTGEVGEMDLEPGPAYAAKLVDATKESPVAASEHFLKYSKTKTETVGSKKLKIRIKAYTAFGPYSKKTGIKRLAEAYGSFLEEGRFHGGSSNIFLSQNNFPQPIRVDFPMFELGNKSTVKWTIMWIDVDQNVMEEGRNTIEKDFKGAIDEQIKIAVNIIEDKYHDDKGEKATPAGLITGIGKTTSKVKSKPLKKKGSPKVKTPTGVTTTGVTTTGVTTTGVTTTGVTTTGVTTTGAATPSAKSSNELILLEEPKSEGETDLLFVLMAQVGDLEGFKIRTYGNTHTRYDYEVEANWPLSSCGVDYRLKLEKHAKDNSITINADTTVHDVIQNNLIIESKLELKKLVSDLDKKSSPKVIQEINLAIAYHGSLTSVQEKEWDLRKPLPDEKIHPAVTHVLEMKSAPSRRCQVIILSEYY